MAMKPSELQAVCDLVLRKSGIVLDASKEYLVEARLSALAKASGVPSISALLAQFQQPNRAVVERSIVDAMTTNETTFFRDIVPFEAVRNVILPDIMARCRAERRISIWCAASSTGQEPYSLAMLIRESFPQLLDWKMTFIASDLSRDVLDRARAGRYSQMEINRGLPAPLLVKYFKKCGLDWEISPDIRKMVEFKEVNLLEAWPPMPLLDLVFIRNVLIYFSNETKMKILGRIRGMMHPAGYLFLGGSETTLNLDDKLEYVPVQKAGCYRNRARPAAAA